MSKDKNKAFRVYIRREPVNQLTLTVRFEMSEGHGMLSIRRDEGSNSAPSLVSEECDLGARELRAGRFVHVLSGSGRRQSYALSRLTEDLLQRLADDRWTELDALTEYGFRYLVVPEGELKEATPAGAPARISLPPTDPELLGLSPPETTAPSTLQRAMSALRPGGQTPRPAPTARVSGGLAAPVGRPPVITDSDELDAMDLDELRERLEVTERKLADSLTRERDLLEILQRWQEREIRS